MKIISYHPCFEADNNFICAGREPDSTDAFAIKSADAIILPQGCQESLYRMAKQNCTNVFPSFDALFNYPGKIGQIKLFRKTNVLHPKTEFFETVERFSAKIPDFPFVFKFNWGGQGDTVFLIKSAEEFQAILQKSAEYQNCGLSGFLIQEYIPCNNRVLRVVVIGKKFISYWRVLKNNKQFCICVESGAEIDHQSSPDMQELGVKACKRFCLKTGINLAGFDILFRENTRISLFLEINYFFGRQGLGGSEKYYDMLISEIKKWIREIR